MDRRGKKANVEEAIKCQKNSKHITNISHYIITIEDIILMSDERGKKTPLRAHFQMENSCCSTALTPTSFVPYSLFFLLFLFLLLQDGMIWHRLKGIRLTPSIEHEHIQLWHARTQHTQHTQRTKCSKNVLCAARITTTNR